MAPLGSYPLENAQKYYHRENELDQIDILVDGSFKKSAQGLIIESYSTGTSGSGFVVIYPASQGKRIPRCWVATEIGLNFLSGMACLWGHSDLHAYSMTCYRAYAANTGCCAPLG